MTELITVGNHTEPQIRIWLNAIQSTKQLQRIRMRTYAVLFVMFVTEECLGCLLGFVQDPVGEGSIMTELITVDDHTENRTLTWLKLTKQLKKV